MDSQGRFTHATIKGKGQEIIFSGTITECEDFWDANIATTKTPAGVRVFYIAASPDVIVNNTWEYE